MLAMAILLLASVLSCVGMLGFIVNSIDGETNASKALQAQWNKWFGTGTGTGGGRSGSGSGSRSGSGSGSRQVAPVPAPALPPVLPPPAMLGGAENSPGAGDPAPRLKMAQVQQLVEDSKKKGVDPVYVWAVSDGCGACLHQMKTLDDMGAQELLAKRVAGVVPRAEWVEGMRPKFVPTLYTIQGGKLTEKSSGTMSPDAIRALP